MNTLNPNTPEQTHLVNRPNWLKNVSLWVVPILTIVFIMVAHTDITFADDCKTTTGQCGTSIGLYVG